MMMHNRFSPGEIGIGEMNQKNLNQSQQSQAGTRCPSGAAAISPYLANFMAECKPKKDFEITIMTDGFKPEEINIEVNEEQGRLMVKAQHEEETKSGTKVTRQIVRSYDMPKDCHFGDLSSRFSPEFGTLTLTNKNPLIIKKNVSNIIHENLFPSSPSCEEIQETEDSVEIKININGFTSDDLRIEMDSDGSLAISGAIVQESINSIVSRQIHRQFAIPYQCLLDQMEKHFSVGFLRISIPKRGTENDAPLPVEDIRG